MAASTFGQLPANVDLVTPVGRGIERDASMAEIRAALGEFRERHGILPWKLLLTGGRA